MTILLISTDWKSESYNLILFIIDEFIKMIYYKSIKIIIDILGLAKIIIDIMISPHRLFNSIIID